MIFQEMQNELQARLSISSVNTFWTADMIKSWLNQANRWACMYKKWPFTEGVKYIESIANQEYYSYPSEENSVTETSFRTDTISRLEVDDESYDKVRYNAFKKIVEEDTAKEKRVFTDYKRFYFIHPIIETSGKIITIWGQEKPKKLVDYSDITPFAEGEEMGEEAIIKKALSIALQKARKYTEAAVQRDEAKLLLEEIWTRIQEEQASYKSKDVQFFDVPKLF